MSNLFLSVLSPIIAWPCHGVIALTDVFDLTMAVEDDNSILDDNANCKIVSDTDDVVDAADAYASAAVSPPGVLICN